MSVDRGNGGMGFAPGEQRLVVSPTYCYRCGSVCDTELRYTGCYDAESGDPLVHIVQVCPNKRWWNRHSRMVWLDDETDKPAEIGLSDIVIKEADCE